MIDTVPPAGHFADCSISLREDGGFDLTVGTAEFGNGTTTVHRQIAATALATTVDRIRLQQSDTAHGGHDTGAYGSAGTFVAGRATQAAAEALAGELKAFARPLHRRESGRLLARQRCDGLRRTPHCRSPLLAASAQALGKIAQRQRHLGRHAALGRLQRAGLSRRGEQGHRRDQDPEKRAGRRCRPRRQSDAVPRPGRGRRRAIARRHAVRGDGDRRRRPRRQSEIPRLSSAVVRRHSAHRSVLRRHLGHASGRWAPNR